MEDCQLSLQRGYKRLGIGLMFFLGLWATVTIAQAQQTAPTITVTVNKSLIFSLPQKTRRVSVTQPEVADVTVVAPNQLLINGKSVGVTSLVIWPQSGEIINYDLVVSPDVDALRRQFKSLFPNENVEILTSGPSIVLRGEVSNEVVYDKVLEITQTYLPPAPAREVAPAAAAQSVSISTTRTTVPTSGRGFAGGGQLAFDEEGRITDGARWGDKRAISGIIDLLKIKEIRQIELDVIVAEVALTKLREIGFDFLQEAGKFSSSTLLGDQSGFPTTLIAPGSTFSATGPLTIGGATSGIFRYASGSYALATLYRALQNKDITEILAQPRLVMKNGRAGGFLAGGEFPVVASTSDRFEVEFKPFGVRLDFVPVLTWSDTIDLRVFPEVSDIDQSVSVNGVPGLKTRRTINRVEMKEGESLVIGGLLDRRVLKDLTKFPLLGDIPILGTLFRSTRFRNQESELIFVITPRVVRPLKPGEKPRLPSTEKYDDSDIRQVPLPGSSVPSGSPAGPTMP